jgi:hypothetical protein
VVDLEDLYFGISNTENISNPHLSYIRLFVPGVMDVTVTQNSQQLTLSNAGGTFEVSATHPHICGQREIVIRLQSITLNPFDAEQYETGSMIAK